MRWCRLSMSGYRPRVAFTELGSIEDRLERLRGCQLLICHDPFIGPPLHETDPPSTEHAGLVGLLDDNVIGHLMLRSRHCRLQSAG